MNKLTVFIALALVTCLTYPAVAKPADAVVDAAVSGYHMMTSATHRVYNLLLRALHVVYSALLYPRVIVTRVLGFTLTYALTKTLIVLTEDFFAIAGVFVKGAGALASFCCSAPLGLFVALNFIISNVTSLLSIFLVSVSSFIPAILSNYVHDFVFNFVEGFSDPWPTMIALWPEIEYYMDALQSITSISGAVSGTQQTTGILSLLSLPINVLLNLLGGLLNAIMFTHIRRGQ
jgi:hypothetical protein